MSKERQYYANLGNRWVSDKFISGTLAGGGIFAVIEVLNYLTLRGEQYAPNWDGLIALLTALVAFWSTRENNPSVSSVEAVQRAVAIQQLRENARKLRRPSDGPLTGRHEPPDSSV